MSCSFCCSSSFRRLLSWQQYWGDELVFKTVADLPMERELYLSARNTWCRNDEEYKCLEVLQDYFDEVLWG